MSAAITAATLQRFAPHCDFLVLGPALAAAAIANDITTPARICAWLGQLFVESEGLTVLEERFNYSAAELHRLWPAHFASLAAAEAAVGKPQVIAEAVYGGRMGNDNAGDGWLYRGRGLTQLTGKYMYGEAHHWTGLDLVATPALAAQSKTAAIIAGAFWKARGCNPHADAGHITEVTRLINGGLTDLAQRQVQTKRASMIWR